jgi:ubiquinone/menaquinone biosynthesis C-methylase UbiE
MERLARVAELLDGPLDDPATAPTLAGNLRDLRRANAFLWGTRLSLEALAALEPLVDALPVHGCGRGRTRVLDVGCGAADIPRAIVADHRRRGRRIEVVAVDSRPEVLVAARSIDSGLGVDDGLVLQVADGRRLPFADDAVDVAHCSMVVHHLEPDDAVALLVEMTRVARVGVVVNDLLRSRRALVGARLLAAVATRNAFTRHDGPLSVRRAYTAPELHALVRRAGLRPITRRTDPFRHRIAIAAVAVPA